MIPKLHVRKEFYDELTDKSEETIEYFKRFEEPYDEFKVYGIAVYPNNSELHLSRKGNGQWIEKYTAMLDDWGYCPSEAALVQYLHNRCIISSKTPYMVTAKLVKIDVAEEDDTYAYYVTEDAEESDMTVSDYIEEYGHPETQYENCLIKFRIFILNE